MIFNQEKQGSKLHSVFEHCLNNNVLITSRSRRETNTIEWFHQQAPSRELFDQCD